MDVQVVATLVREGSKLVSDLLRTFVGHQPAAPSVALKEKPSGPTTDETIEHQKREIVKELLLLEGHLTQSCKIGGKACDCCTKHPITIEGLAEETAGMSTDPVFRELSQWAKSIGDITTEAASASGKYDEEYPKLAIKAREFRKAIMPAEKEV